MSDGRAPRRCHSDRGILEQYDGKFIKASARHGPASPSVPVPYTFSAMTRPPVLLAERQYRAAHGSSFVSDHSDRNPCSSFHLDWVLSRGLRFLTP